MDCSRRRDRMKVVSGSFVLFEIRMKNSARWRSKTQHTERSRNNAAAAQWKKKSQNNNQVWFYCFFDAIVRHVLGRPDSAFTTEQRRQNVILSVRHHADRIFCRIVLGEPHGRLSKLKDRLAKWKKKMLRTDRRSGKCQTNDKTILRSMSNSIEKRQKNHVWRRTISVYTLE